MYPESENNGSDENSEEAQENFTKFYQAGIALRTDGSVTFYADFSIVNHAPVEIIDEKKLFFDDIATDNDKFYLLRKKVDAVTNSIFSRKKTK